MSTPAMSGSCGCGAVTFELFEPPVAAAYCHCTRCQKRTGTASQASAKVAPGSVTVTTGAELLHDWTPPGGLGKTFCTECGSHLFGREPDGEIVIVRMAAIDGDPVVRPMAHQFVASAASWEEIREDGLPRFEERIPGT